jgi:uncharacterized protein (DUF1800 family)
LGAGTLEKLAKGFCLGKGTLEINFEILNMKAAVKYLLITATVVATLVLFSFFSSKKNEVKQFYHFPYKQAGLTERQAAAHLLSRFTYGATPHQVEEVVSIGLEKWFERQLSGSLADDTLNRLLSQYEALRMSNSEIVKTYQPAGQALRMAIREGMINKDSVNKGDKEMYRKQLLVYMQNKGLKSMQELIHQFINQKIIRVVYSNNQLQEVLTEFWFNHFNVSFAKRQCAQFIPSYERDVIRPNALADFESLLIATAKSPAMLTYLDNFISTGANSRQAGRSKGTSLQDSAGQKKVNQIKRAKGLNENYAREVMELHTLGVDGGYTQQDVTEAARVLTGWTIYPMRDGGDKKMMKQAEEKKPKGFVFDGDFLFTPNRHDDGKKIVLGRHFKAGGGYEEGVQLLKTLAHHPSTAEFISRKVATRFVQDNPPQSLVNKMAETFKQKGGDIKRLLIAMVTSSEFWEDSAFRAKTKSPFELAISAVRALGANVDQPYALFNWIDRMGQKMYYYQAPTGFPDQGQYWINSSSLLNRMNFGLVLATGKIPGVTFDLLSLNNDHEPESAGEALKIYSKLIMPERDIEETIERLMPLLNDPSLQRKVSKAADSADMTQEKEKNEFEDIDELAIVADNDTVDNANQNSKIDLYKLSQVIGIIIGSPEFQRR